ncbi:MAG: hypothetical protein WCK14_01015 [Actinomycetota bacterium]|jgi:hypothetical protein
MNPPLCSSCNQPIARALDLPYGWWEWNGQRYVLHTASQGVDVAPWVHADCMNQLRGFHPADYTVLG